MCTWLQVVASELKRALDAAKAKHTQVSQQVDALTHQLKEATTKLSQLRSRTDQAANLLEQAQTSKIKKEKALGVVRTDMTRSEERAAQSATAYHTAQQQVTYLLPPPHPASNSLLSFSVYCPDPCLSATAYPLLCYLPLSLLLVSLSCCIAR